MRHYVWRVLWKISKWLRNKCLHPPTWILDFLDIPSLEMVSLGRNIDGAIKCSGRSVDEIVDALSCDKKHLRRVIKGHAFLLFADLSMLSDMTGVSVEDLLGKTNNSFTKV